MSALCMYDIVNIVTIISMYFSKNRGDHKICDLVKPARCPRPKALVCSLDCPACPQV